jgi:actin
MSYLVTLISSFQSFVVLLTVFNPVGCADGQVISIGDERFRCSEPLFQPGQVGHDPSSGLHQMADQSILQCDIDIRQDLFRNIVLAGGNTMFEGMAERLTKEMNTLIPSVELSPMFTGPANKTTVSAITVRVIAPPERNEAAWIGGSIFASLSTFEKQWILKEVNELNATGTCCVTNWLVGFGG